MEYEFRSDSEQHGNGIGNGSHYFENGDVYTGEWRAGQMHGKGVYTYANQDVYDGEWEEDLKHGKGTMKHHNGDVYKGEFSNGKIHGKGVMKYADGGILKSTGEWEDGKKFGWFEDVVRVSKQVYYDNYGVQTESKLKHEASVWEDTDTEDLLPPSKRRNVSVSPL